MAPTIRGETPPDERAAAARAVVASRSVVMVAEGASESGVDRGVECGEERVEEDIYTC